jgi:hypothetical protein
MYDHHIDDKNKKNSHPSTKVIISALQTQVRNSSNEPTVNQKHLESFKMWCWRSMEISWTEHVRNEEVLLTVNEQRNILHGISKGKDKWIGHSLCRNCFLQQVIEGKIKEGIEVTVRRGRRRRKLVDDLNP